MYTAPLLAQLLAKQTERRQPGLFRQGVFTLPWRAKVGSFPSPDTETLISAGEPYGHWRWSSNDFANVQARPDDLPLRCYVPASSIRGIVKSWIRLHNAQLKERMSALLGDQDKSKNSITAGKVEFLDAWPTAAISPAKDVVTPQARFQVFHDTKVEPHTLYTLGNGKEPVEIVVSIRGIPGKATAAEVDEVWQWVQQALSTQGIGSRTSAGYGQMSAPPDFSADEAVRSLSPTYTARRFNFQLLSQGCYGAYLPTKENGYEGIPDLRPTHWRGWLRGWLWRFLLGVMSEENATITLAELMGNVGEEGERATKGQIKIAIDPSRRRWGEASENRPDFYDWQGQVTLSGPKDTLNKIVLPIMRFAAMIGGLGRGWRRPLHYYENHTFSRGSHLSLDLVRPNRNPLPWIIQLQPKEWSTVYEKWKISVADQWPERIASQTATKKPVDAEVFSPTTCAVYAVPGPLRASIDFQQLEWLESNAKYTRGEGITLIYDSKYKRKTAVGGIAANSADSQCSWVSIRQVPAPHPTLQTDWQEIVCLFMGAGHSLRQSFLTDLRSLEGANHLFGLH